MPVTKGMKHIMPGYRCCEDARLALGRLGGYGLPPIPFLRKGTLFSGTPPAPPASDHLPGGWVPALLIFRATRARPAC